MAQPSSAFIEPVGALIRSAAREAILPRYRRIAAHEIEEKGPGDLVTIADREAEVILEAGLLALAPGIPVIGEERAHATPGLLASRRNCERYWLVDPVDGTIEFANGNPGFGTIVALVERGEICLGWIYDPLTDTLRVAQRRQGASVEGRPLRMPQKADATLRGAVWTGIMPAVWKDRLESRVARLDERAVPPRSAAHTYPLIAEGQIDFLLCWRTLPWDHAAGTLLVCEVGGRAARLDGTRYDPNDDREGLLVARNEAIWNRAHAALLGDIDDEFVRQR